MFEKHQNILDTPRKQCHKDTVTKIRNNSTRNDSSVNESDSTIRTFDTFKGINLETNKSKTTNQEVKQLKESSCQSHDDDQSSAESVPGIVILQSVIEEVMSKIEYAAPLKTHLSDAEIITCNKEDNVMNKKEDEIKIKIEEERKRLEKKTEEERERKVIDQMLNESLSNELEDKRNDEMEMRLEVTEKFIDECIDATSEEIIENILEEDISTNYKYEIDQMLNERLSKELEDKINDEVEMRLEVTEKIIDECIDATLEEIIENILEEDISLNYKYKTEMAERIKMSKISHKPRSIKCISNSLTELTQITHCESQPTEKSIKRQIQIKNCKKNHDVGAQIGYIELQRQTKELQSIEAEEAEKQKADQIISRIVKEAYMNIVKEAELKRTKNYRIKMAEEVKNVKVKEPENNQLEKPPSKKQSCKRQIDIQNEKHDSNSSNEQSSRNAAITNKVEPPVKRSRQSLRLQEKKSIKNCNINVTSQNAAKMKKGEHVTKHIRSSLKLEQGTKKTGTHLRFIYLKDAIAAFPEPLVYNRTSG